jgi:hypothetical protein
MGERRRKKEKETEPGLGEENAPMQVEEDKRKASGISEPVFWFCGKVIIQLSEWNN